MGQRQVDDARGADGADGAGQGREGAAPRGSAAPLRSEAFIRRAVRDWGGSVYRLALSHTGSRADAEDVCQEVFIRLACDATAFRDGEHLKAWLLRVAVNCCHDLARRKKRRSALPLDDLPFEPVGDDLATRERARELWAAVEALPESSRPLVHLRYYEGYSAEEIAHLLNLNSSTVRTRLQRARAKLKSLLEGEGA